MYAYVSTLLFSEVWPAPSLLGDMTLRRTFSEQLNGPRWDDVRNTSKDDVASQPLRTPFWILSLHFTSAHSETFRVVVALIPRFEDSVGFTTDFPVQRPESEISRLEPRFKGLGFEGVICPCCLPLELLTRWNHYFFRFQSALCVPLVTFLIMFFFHYFELDILVGVPVPGVNSLHQIEEDQLVLSQARQYMSNNRLYTPY